MKRIEHRRRMREAKENLVAETLTARLAGEISENGAQRRLKDIRAARDFYALPKSLSSPLGGRPYSSMYMDPSDSEIRGKKLTSWIVDDKLFW